MHYDPKCRNDKHKCKQVCISSSCTISNPFICDGCDNQHQSESCKIITYKKLVNHFRKINGTYTNDLLKFEERVQNTFSELMGGLRHHFVKFREQIEYLNVHPKVEEVYLAIKNNRQSDLTAVKINKAYCIQPRKNEKIKVKDQLSMRMLRDNLFELNSELLRKLPPYYSLKMQLIEEPEETVRENKIKMIEDNYVDKRKIVKGIFNDHFGYFEQILSKPIYNVQLLYRATDHQFSAQAFHKKCDGITNTVTVAKTQYGNIVIGYSTFPWQSPSQWEYKIDTRGQCFLISPHPSLNGRKFTPFKTKFAIGMHRDYGPSFGDDFVIYNKAHNSKNCWSNFPDVYTCKARPIPHNEDTIEAFVGTSDHFEKFNLVEWQVYKVSFEQKQQLQKSFMVQYRKIK